MNELSRFVEGRTGKSWVGAYLEDEKWSLTARLVRAGLVFLSLVSLIVTAAVLTQGVAINPRNLANIGPQSVTTIMAAAAMVFLFAQGGIDFSFMSVASLSCAVFVKLLAADASLPAAIGLAICAAAGIGLLNGLLIAITRLPGFLLTIITAILAQSIVNVSLQGMTIPLDLGDAARTVMGVFFAVNWIIALAVFVLASLASYAPGIFKKASPVSNESLAASGLRLGLPYAVSGLIAGLTGIFFAFRLGAATPMFGRSWEHEILFVLFFSGTIFGCRAGNPLGVFLAAIYLSILNNMNSILGLDHFVQILIITVSTISSAFYNLGYEALVSYLYKKKKAKLAAAAA